MPTALPRALTTEEVEGIIEKFVQAAVRAKYEVDPITRTG